MRIRFRGVKFTAAALSMLVLGTVAVATASGANAADAVPPTLHSPVSHTTKFLNALERKDVPAVSAMLASDARWEVRMTAAGTQDPEVVTGREQITAALTALAAPFSQVRFIDRRISVVEGGRTTFVQAHGDFVTTDGRPYRNVYVFRFDWRHGKLTTWEEYPNPVTICRTFPQPDCA